jgi:hypothetical protein
MIKQSYNNFREDEYSILKANTCSTYLNIFVKSHEHCHCESSKVDLVNPFLVREISRECENDTQNTS